MRSLCSVFLLFVATHASAAEPCTPSAEVLALVDKDNAENDASVDPKVYAPPLVAEWKQYLAGHPTDAFALQELYSLFVDALDDRVAFRTELEAARKAGLDEVMALDLEARLAAPDVAAAEAKYRAAIAISPKSHAANLGLAQLLLKQKKLAAARAPILIAIDACPDDLYAYRALAALKDKPLLAAHLKTLRAHLDASKDGHFLPTYGMLWELSFHGASPPAQVALRKQVGVDVARLRALGDALTLRLFETIASGYKILGDREGERWVIAERARRFPDARDTVNAALDAMNEAEATHIAHHPAERHEHAARKLEITRAWVKKWPRWSVVWEEQLEALRGAPHASVAEVEQATAALVKLGSLSYSSIMDAYEHFGIHTDQIAKLADKDVAHAEASLRDFSRSARPEQKEWITMLTANVQRTKLGGLALVIRAQIKLGQKDAARASLKNMETALAALPPTTKPDELEERHYFESELFAERGRVANADGHTADALAYFLHALSLVPPDKDPPEVGEIDVRTDADQAWTKLGGSKPAYAFLPTGAARPQGGAEDLWRASAEPAPSFTLRDLKGKSWRLRDLAGKTVIMTVWATWCQPCKMEMPDVKALALKLAGNKDVILLSLNVDQDVSVVAPFVKEQDLKYPVLLQGEGANPFLKAGDGIPLTVLIDKHGQIRGRTTGFHPDLQEGEWLTATLKAIEAVASK
jgi:thiol-disulfide isomerase/thioredoxin